MPLMIAIGVFAITLFSAAPSAAKCVATATWACSGELSGASGYAPGGTAVRRYEIRGDCRATLSILVEVSDIKDCCEGQVAFDRADAEYDPKTGRARFRGAVLGAPNCPSTLKRFASGGMVDEEYVCPADPWLTPGVVCKMIVPGEGNWGGCFPEYACPPFTGTVSKQEAFGLSQENAIAKAAAEAEKQAQEEKLRRVRLEKARVLKPKDGLAGAPATKLQQPGRAASGMAHQTASVRVPPPLIVQPKPGVDPGDRLKIEIRGQAQASKKYEIEIEGKQGSWKRFYQRSLGADSGGVARFELTLSQLASSETGMEWRLRTRGESPQTPWSNWVSFRATPPKAPKGRLKQPKTDPTPPPRGRLKLPKRKM